MKSFIVIFFLVLLVFTNAVLSQIEKKTSPPGELNEVHSHLSNQKKCLSCHDPGYGINFGKCLACHKEILTRIQSASGYHRDKNEDCHVCHQEHRGKKSKLVDIDIKDFDHKETGYILDGAHIRISDCRKCHAGPNLLQEDYPGSFLLRSRKCSACHLDIHNKMFTKCEECHSTDDWSVDIWLP